MDDINMNKLLDITLDDVILQDTGLRTLPMPPTNTDIIKLLIDWIELLSLEEYEKALSMFFHDESCNAKVLEEAVYGYGVTGYTKGEVEQLFGCIYKVTSLFNSPYKREIFNKIDIEFFQPNKKRDMNIIGDVHFNLVPLNNKPSDLTARFWIRKVDDSNFTLEFEDMHVM